MISSSFTHHWQSYPYVLVDDNNNNMIGNSTAYILNPIPRARRTVQRVADGGNGRRVGLENIDHHNHNYNQGRVGEELQQQLEQLDYECDREDDDALFSDYKCSICLGVFIEACHLRTCAHKFCNFCINKWLKMTSPNSVCPICRDPVSTLPEKLSDIDNELAWLYSMLSPSDQRLRAQKVRERQEEERLETTPQQRQIPQNGLNPNAPSNVYLTNPPIASAPAPPPVIQIQTPVLLQARLVPVRLPQFNPTVGQPPTCYLHPNQPVQPLQAPPQNYWPLRLGVQGIVPLPFGVNDHLHFSFGYGTPVDSSHVNPYTPPLMDRPSVYLTQPDRNRPNVTRFNLSFDIVHSH